MEYFGVMEALLWFVFPFVAFIFTLIWCAVDKRDRKKGGKEE